MSDIHSGVLELYPFLYGNRKDREGQQQALLESVRRKALDSVEVKQAFFKANEHKVVAAAQLLRPTQVASETLACA